MKIIFMGTPDFARVSLEALLEAGNDVVAVITPNDKPVGRKQILTPPPVKSCALERGIPVYQPQTLKNGAINDILSLYSPEMIVVVAYGKILPDYVLKYPKYGCINLHGSLLPAYRGAAPMQRAIMAGEKTVGVTCMRMDAGVDTGDMISKSSTELGSDEDFGTVHDRLAMLGAKLLTDTIVRITTGKAEYIPQNDEISSYAAKIEADDCRIDFSEGAKHIHDLIRALSPAPLAFTTLCGKKLKVTSSEIIDKTDEIVSKISGETIPGTVFSLEKGMICVACGDGTAIALTGVLPEGKKSMRSADFIRGRGIGTGDILGK